MEDIMVYKNWNGVSLSALGMGCMRLPQKSENGADIDEAALADALNNRNIAAAALDVFSSEPLHSSPL